ncbi:SusD/RagB family nutrient-binding outer membrane lipoprotein [Sphingobacterium phlebotomi]|uniref:SusD/RagB family nutrient-binding outer membrane lipoprotein n=1 Tax=Sphingobacterium phlebotomi TaxID=2605433 RepID=A0A5D4HA86_9SPHI|nr:SusD/RagB family nutrient-binding outer membrane lipoprotein [Sphingobacterium phlebotomi]TYR37558.1 SusD/RagB family nutrient-binding outer membrane lipoprotein [Sphingobacterium phlebotomi]
MRFITKRIGCSFIIGALLLSNTSCNDYLDINKSPLTATEIDPSLVFGYAVTAWDANKNSGDGWLPVGLMAQNLASGGNFGWGRENVYDISVYSLGNTWKTYYSTGGNNLMQAIKIAESADPVQNNAAAQSKIVLAQFIYEATALYGDVPFSEAWNPEEFPYPKYDNQKDVLYGIVRLLDEAIAQIEEDNVLKIKDYDIYYNGEMSQWKKLANSIKFKVFMLMVDAEPTVAEQIGQLLSADNMISSTADSWIHKYYERENNENPKFRLLKDFNSGVNNWFFANTNVLNYMHINDPRIPLYFDAGEAANGEFIAVGTNLDASEETATISAKLYRADAPSVILSYHELLLLQAEAYARGLGVTQDLTKADELYKEGVKQACIFYGASVSDATSFVSEDLESLVSTTNPLNEIHIQQWIDFMDRPQDAFIQWRRSGPEGQEVPILSLPSGAPAGPLIRRWTLSPDETAANPNIPNPQPRYSDKMWFDL